MATLTSVTHHQTAPSLIARWHLLSLDAPSIAALWTWFVAWSAHVPISPLAPLAMFLAVWTLYAADRLLDARAITLSSRSRPFVPWSGDTDLEARHLFHARHRPRFLRAIGTACLALAIIVPRLPASALRLDAVLGTMLVAYLLLIHATPAARRLPKEIAVGVFFAAAVFIPTIARQPALRRSLLPSALLFGALCSLNCLCIYGWEHAHANRAHHASVMLRESSSSATGPHSLTRLALGHLRPLHLLVITLALLLAWFGRQPIALAIALAAAALLALDRLQPRLNRIDLRASADLVLATPLLVVPLFAALPHLGR